MISLNTEGTYHGPNIATSVHLAIISRINMENFVVLFTHLVCRHNIECKTFQLDEAFLFSIREEKLFSLYLLLWKTMFFPLMESSTLSVHKKIDLELCVRYFGYGVVV